MFGAIKHALANLANFNGRDSRQTFWFWVLFVVILRFAAGMLIAIPMTAHMVQLGLEVAKSGAAHDPDLVNKMINDLIVTELPRMIWFGIAVAVVTMMLLCASLVRRLHDSGLSGWLVLIPGALYAAVIAQMPAQIDVAVKVFKNLTPGTPPNPAALMQAQGWMALMAWVPVLIVIWFGVRKSSEGPNAYGDAPVSF